MSDRLSFDGKYIYDGDVPVLRIHPGGWSAEQIEIFIAKLANRSELANVGAAVAWQWKLAGESEWMVTDTRPFLQTGMEIYALTRITAPTPAAPPNEGAENYFRCQVCAALGEHIDTDSERLIAAIIDLRDQCREPPAPLASKCVGYPDCDGDLIGEPHEPSCPAATGERGEGRG